METHRYTRWDESTNSYKIKKEFQNINPEHYLNLLGMAETMIDVLEKKIKRYELQIKLNEVKFDDKL